MATIAEIIQVAAQHQRAHQLSAAEQIYQQVLKVQPDNVEALYGYSVLAQQMGNYAIAEQHLRLMSQLQPTLFKVWFSLGNVHQVQGHLAEAVAAYQRALLLQPKAAPLYNNLGYALQLQGQLDAAIAQYQKALQLQPTFREAQANLANAQFELGQLSADQQRQLAHFNHQLGCDRRRTGDWQTAATYFRQATVLQPQWGLAHYDLGQALQAQGRFAAAVPSYIKTVAFAEDSAAAYVTLARQKLELVPPSATPQSPSPRLKVAFICQPFVMTRFPNPADSIGILTYGLVRRLSLEFDVVVYGAGPKAYEETIEGICYRYFPVQQDERWLKRLEKVPGWFTTRRPSFASDLYYRGFAEAIAQDLQQRPVDIVHIHNLAQFAPTIRRHNPKMKVVLHMHCEWLNQLNRRRLEKSLAAVDRVITPSQYITGQTQQRFPQMAERCATIYNGVDVDNYLNHQAEPATAATATTKNILFVGRVCPEKGVHTLLEAFQRVVEREHTAKLTVVGPIGVIPFEYLVGISDDEQISALARFHQGDAWSDYLRGYMSQMNERVGSAMANPVTFTGIVLPSQLPAFYQQADIFVFPSVCHEAFGMPIAEAMVSGLPVVATTAGAFPELVQSGETGLIVERDDADAMASAILQLLDDAELRQSMGAASRQRALQRFTFDKVAGDLRRLYLDLQMCPLQMLNREEATSFSPCQKAPLSA
ncbi:MAG: glycosyltransferase [Nodosilinea sp.]